MKHLRLHTFLRTLSTALIACASLALSGCGYNSMVSGDEGVKSSWAEVLNQYQRCADLIPNIVNSVKGEANFEQETLIKVIEARSKGTPELANNPEALAKFNKAQGEVSSALSRLLVVTENYPNKGKQAEEEA